MRSNLNLDKVSRRERGYDSMKKLNLSRVKVYKGYIEFIEKIGFSELCPSDLEVVLRSKRMLGEVGYLTVPLQDTLEKVFNKTVK